MSKQYIWYNTNVYNSLTKEQKRNNARNVRDFFSRFYDWRIEAICALCGNMSAESGFSPTQWERGEVYGRGYGLVQWTPYTNLSDWAIANGKDWEGPQAGTTELERLVYEYVQKLEYYPSKKDPIGKMVPTWRAFAHDTMSTPTDVYPDPEPLTVSLLTSAFLFNYLRPKDPYGSLENRIKAAEQWEAYFKTLPPVRSNIFPLLAYYMQKRR